MIVCRDDPVQWQCGMPFRKRKPIPLRRARKQFGQKIIRYRCVILERHVHPSKEAVGSLIFHDFWSDLGLPDHFTRDHDLLDMLRPFVDLEALDVAEISLDGVSTGIATIPVQQHCF